MKKTFIPLLLSGSLLVSVFSCQDSSLAPGNGGPTTPGAGSSGPGGSSSGSTTGSTTSSSTTATAGMAAAVTTSTCSSSSGLAKVVCLAEAFKATLSSTQLAAVQLNYTTTNAKKWSNLPAAMSSRVGINLGSLTATQLAAFNSLMNAVTGQGTTNEGYDELVGNLVADDNLMANGGGTTYGGANYYFAFLGTPSTSGLWELQFGGHHYTFANTFSGGSVTGWTPAFRGVEPMAALTYNSRSYQPVEQERAAMASLLSGLSSTELASAKLSSTFSDLLLGPGVDWQFPSTKSGVRVGNLSSTKQSLVLSIIKLYTGDLDATTAASVLATYTAALADTYIAYSGTGAMSTKGDYFRIDGPRVWIEYSTQGGIIYSSVPHPHSVWRDRVSDYGGNQ